MWRPCLYILPPAIRIILFLISYISILTSIDMNPLRKYLFLMEMYLQILLSAVQNEQEKARAERPWKRKHNRSRHDSFRRSNCFNDFMGWRSWFRRNNETFQFPDEVMQGSDMCTAASSTVSQSSSTWSDVESDWQVEDQEMEREINRMVHILNSRPDSRPST